jgi:hypothetical protein
VSRREAAALTIFSEYTLNAGLQDADDFEKKTPPEGGVLIKSSL